MAGKKIIKIDGGKKPTKKVENKSVELTEEELTLKEELLALDKKVESVYKVISQIEPEDEESLIAEDILSNIVGITTVTAATTIIGKYLGVDEDTLKNLI